MRDDHANDSSCASRPSAVKIREQRKATTSRPSVSYCVTNARSLISRRQLIFPSKLIPGARVGAATGEMGSLAFPDGNWVTDVVDGADARPIGRHGLAHTMFRTSDDDNRNWDRKNATWAL